MEKFMKLFNFREEGALLVGIERECFIVNEKGEIVPRASEMLKYLPDRFRFGYELSACQFEDRIGPLGVSKIKDSLLENEKDISAVEKELKLGRWHIEVAPENIPLDVYPDPTGRYQAITKKMPPRILSAACRVAGIHIHIGMPNHRTAMNVYNKVRDKAEALYETGDGSNGERLRIYRIMAPDYMPFRFGSWLEFYEIAVKKGFVTDPRKCWTLIRISVHGTIEFRMFGATPDLDRIVGWAEVCYNLCRDAMR